VTLPGATTCSEARAIGRRLLLLDLMPGHGRDNLLHELELGGAHTCLATPEGVTASILANPEIQRQDQRDQRGNNNWEQAYLAALRHIGLELRPAAVTAPAPTLRPVA
jgi:hypothetical protein